MAVTGFWPVFKNLKATLDYADNPDKTTAPEYMDEDLYRWNISPVKPEKISLMTSRKPIKKRSKRKLTPYR